MKATGWDERLSVKADGKGMVGHAGAALLRRCADRTGLTTHGSALCELVQPDEAWDYGNRRVPGLRREEVAFLAGISSDYYNRLEQGRDKDASEQVLHRIARALRLDEEATTYLLEIATRKILCGASGPASRSRSARARARSSVGQEAITHPAIGRARAGATFRRWSAGWELRC